METVKDPYGEVRVVHDRFWEASVPVSFLVYQNRNRVFESAGIDLMEYDIGDNYSIGTDVCYEILNIDQVSVIIRVGPHGERMALGFYAYDIMDGYPFIFDDNEGRNARIERMNRLALKSYSIIESIGVEVMEELIKRLGMPSEEGSSSD